MMPVAVSAAVIEDDGRFFAVAQAQLEEGLRLVLESQAIPDRGGAEGMIEVVSEKLSKMVNLRERPKKEVVNGQVEEALDRIQDLIARANDLPDRAEDFASGVIQTLEDMFRWIDEHQHVTPKQLAALDNIEGGIGR